jgi:DNA-binding ferritin-like protein (Dps family)
MQSHPEDYAKMEAQAALILPKNYGWAFRNLNDRIWGYWGSDENSQQIWELTQDLLDQYEYALDIVYDDPDFPIADMYPEIYYWNQTR